MKNAIAQWKCENISIIRVRTVAKILLYIVDVIICVSPIILIRYLIKIIILKSFHFHKCLINLHYHTLRTIILDHINISKP